MLERALVLLGDLLAQELVVPEGAEPEVGNTLRRLLVRVVPILGLCIDVLLALDDGRALGVEGRVELGVPLLQRALLLEELAVELVVFALRLGQRVDASANLPMQGLDETAAHPDEIVELVLERADEPGVVAKLAEGLEHLSLIDMGELRVFWGDGGTVRVCTWGLDLGGHVFASVSAALSGGRVSSFGGFSGRDCVTLVVRSSALAASPSRGTSSAATSSGTDSIWKKSSASWHSLQTNVSRSTLPSLYMTWSSSKGIGPCCTTTPFWYASTWR